VAVGVTVAVLFAGAVQAQVRRVPEFVGESEARAYATNVVGATLERYAKNPSELPAVRERLRRFLDMSSSEALGYNALPFSLPTGKLVQMDWNASSQRPTLTVSIPDMMLLQERRAKTEFEDNIALIFVAEMIRYEQAAAAGAAALANLKRSAADLRGEAAVWGQTIIEVVRPWGSQGRVPDQRLLALSFTLQRLKDNYKDPTWVRQYTQFGRQN
jgi:hypothetical protein